ncbi:hypothetical protein DY000_02022500 [Brassica cretica]|uniref:Uncharacterized protein n=1 Tax=Brassica cretica TaxID=69181 RepID=A0ABQ7EAA7_BRACR|nr:hypothetical protein DY000_02022500 [Brassica cretica]
MAATKMVFHHMVLIFQSFKDLDLDMQVFQIWKTSGTTYYPSVLVFNQMVLIFHLDMFFRFGADFGRFMESLLGSLLKYNVIEDFFQRLLKYHVLEDFQEVFQKTSWKSSDGVFFHIKWSPSLSLERNDL